MSSRSAILLGLALANAALALALGLRTSHAQTVYVFTPLVDVVPGGVPLNGTEAADLAQDARHQIDQRDIQQAFARMGSTLSLANLVQGMEGLESAGHPLSPNQRRAVTTILSQAEADHRAIQSVQKEILDLEREVQQRVDAVLQALPPQVRGQMEASTAPVRGGTP